MRVEAASIDGAPDSPTSQPHKPLRTIRRLAIIFASYCLIAYLVHGVGYDLSGVLLGGGDGYTYGFPSKLFASTLSAWNPNLQLGTYAFANTQAQPFYPPALIALAFFPNTFGYNLFILVHYAVAGWFFFLYARNLRLKEYSAYLGGVCFMCGGFMLAHKGNEAMLSAGVWLPLMLLSVDRYVKSRRLREAAVGGVALALCVLSGFPQITLYASGLVFLYLTYRCLCSGLPLMGRLGILTAGLATIFVTGILMSSLQLFAVAESLPYVSREKISLEMFNEGSLPISYFGMLVVPNMVGSMFGVPCFKPGGCGVDVYSYDGFLPLILAAFASLWLWRTRADVVFWTVSISIAVVLSLGLSPVQSILYRVPIYNLFRVPARHLFEVTFGISVLAAYGADAVFAEGRVQGSARALSGTTIAIAVLLMGVLSRLQLDKYALNHLSRPEFAALGEYRPVGSYPVKDIAVLITSGLELWRPTSLFPILCMAASVFTLWLAAKHPMVTAWRFAIVLVLLLDVALPYRTLYDNPSTSAIYQPEAVPDIAFMQSHGLDNTRDRVYPIDAGTELTFPVLSLLHRIPVINDYGPMWFKRYQAVTGFISNGQSQTAWFSPALMDVLSVKFLVVHDQQIAHQLRWISQAAPKKKVSLPLPELNCAALICRDARFSESGVITLGSTGAEKRSIIQLPLEPEPNTLYEISFEGRSPAESIGPLDIDLYSDRPEWEGFGGGQKRSIISFGPAYTKISVLIDSGHTAVKQGYVRLYTTSPGPYEIRNLMIAKAEPVPRAYKEAFGAPNGNIVFENPTALPRFRFVSELVPASSVAEAREIIMSSSFDPGRQVTVEGLSNPTRVDSGTVLSQHIENDLMTWQVETGMRGFFVVADSWFPGWIATVDGRTEPIHIVNGFLRGVSVTGLGRHLIRMEFHPRSVRYGLIGTIAGCLLLAMITILSSFRERAPR
jgi:hypothetical protein